MFLCRCVVVCVFACLLNFVLVGLGGICLFECVFVPSCLVRVLVVVVAAIVVVFV